jgi:hypothetical protein
MPGTVGKGLVRGFSRPDTELAAAACNGAAGGLVAAWQARRRDQGAARTVFNEEEVCCRVKDGRHNSRHHAASIVAPTQGARDGPGKALQYGGSTFEASRGRGGVGKARGRSSGRREPARTPRGVRRTRGRGPARRGAVRRDAAQDVSVCLRSTAFFPKFLNKSAQNN